jgi:hypothetical protein
MMPQNERVRAFRVKHQCSLFEANHAVRQEMALEALESASSIDDLKVIVRELILETKYNSNIRG